MKAWKNKAGSYRTELHDSVRYKMLLVGEGRRSQIPGPAWCLRCIGFGIDRTKVDTVLCLMPQFYDCDACNGTGRRIIE